MLVVVVLKKRNNYATAVSFFRIEIPVLLQRPRANTTSTSWLARAILHTRPNSMFCPKSILWKNGSLKANELKMAEMVIEEIAKSSYNSGTHFSTNKKGGKLYDNECKQGLGR